MTDPIEQRHRDAAASYWFRTAEATDANFDVGHRLRIGEADDNELVQAFARFEASLTSTTAEAMKEAFERGFLCAYAEAVVQNDCKPPFELTDAIIEKAWDNRDVATPPPASGEKG